MTAPRNPLADICLLQEKMQYDLLKGLLGRYTEALAKGDHKTAAALRIDCHDKLDHILDLIDGNLRKLGIGPPR